MWVCRTKHALDKRVGLLEKFEDLCCKHILVCALIRNLKDDLRAAHVNCNQRALV